MFKFPQEINISEITKADSEKKAKAVEKLANNLTLAALEVLAKKSAKPGMSKKVMKFKAMM